VAQIGRSIFGDKFYTDVMTGRAFDAAFDLDLIASASSSLACSDFNATSLLSVLVGSPGCLTHPSSFSSSPFFHRVASVFPSPQMTQLVE
jgi:hypothetical protein